MLVNIRTARGTVQERTTTQQTTKLKAASMSVNTRTTSQTVRERTPTPMGTSMSVNSRTVNIMGKALERSQMAHVKKASGKTITSSVKPRSTYRTRITVSLPMTTALILTVSVSKPILISYALVRNLITRRIEILELVAELKNGRIAGVATR